MFIAALLSLSKSVLQLGQDHSLSAKVNVVFLCKNGNDVEVEDLDFEKILELAESYRNAVEECNALRDSYRVEREKLLAKYEKKVKSLNKRFK